MLALPWLVVTGVTALEAGLRRLPDPDRLPPQAFAHATDAAVAFLAVGAAFALTDRLGARPFDFPATIILLTAVHFHFAGFVLPLAGALAYRVRPSRWLEIALGAVVVGIPVTALGFFGIPIANWIGAMLTAVGGFGIGLATLLVARTMARRSAVGLAVAAGVSLLVSMPMAAIYTTGVLVGTTWLDLATMAAVHGTLNALGFAVPVIVAWTLDRRARAAANSSTRTPARDPRRLGLGRPGSSPSTRWSSVRSRPVWAAWRAVESSRRRRQSRGRSSWSGSSWCRRRSPSSGPFDAQARS